MNPDVLRTLLCHVHEMTYDNWLPTVVVQQPAYTLQVGVSLPFSNNMYTFSILDVFLLFLICYILLHHTTNLSIGVEMLPDGPFFVKGTANFLCSAANRSISCVRCQRLSVAHILSRTILGRQSGIIPLNIDPTAPSFENTLVPVPVVFSPAAG